MIKRSIVRIAKKTAFALFFLFAAILILASVFNLRILIEQQDVACLPYKVVAVRFHHVDKFQRGDIIAFTPPNNLMGKLFDKQLIVKMVGAVPGDTVSVKNGVLSINNKEFGPLDIAKSASRYLGRDVASFERTEIVPPGMLLVVGTLPRAFDGRYWGFLPQDAVMGSVYPIF